MGGRKVRLQITLMKLRNSCKFLLQWSMGWCNKSTENTLYIVSKFFTLGFYPEWLTTSTLIAPKLGPNSTISQGNLVGTGMSGLLVCTGLDWSGPIFSPDSCLFVSHFYNLSRYSLQKLPSSHVLSQQIHTHTHTHPQRGIVRTEWSVTTGEQQP